MKAMSLPVYHHNGFMATHALGHMMYGYTLLVPMNQRVLILLFVRFEHSVCCGSLMNTTATFSQMNKTLNSQYHGIFCII